jgi:hypothetical protein
MMESCPNCDRTIEEYELVISGTGAWHCGCYWQTQQPEQAITFENDVELERKE